MFWAFCSHDWCLRTVGIVSISHLHISAGKNFESKHTPLIMAFKVHCVLSKSSWIFAWNIVVCCFGWKGVEGGHADFEKSNLICYAGVVVCCRCCLVCCCSSYFRLKLFGIVFNFLIEVLWVNTYVVSIFIGGVSILWGGLNWKCEESSPSVI